MAEGTPAKKTNYNSAVRTHGFFTGSSPGYVPETCTAGNGTIDVHTVRNGINNGDGSISAFGSLTGMEAYDRQEFGQKDFNIYYPSSNETTYVNNPAESSAADKKTS